MMLKRLVLGRRQVLLAAVVIFAVSCGRDGAEPRGARAPLHILLVTLDTTRADHMGFLGAHAGDMSPTPALDALAEEGIVYDPAFASAPLTLPSHATLMTGLEPPEHGLRENEGYVLPPPSDRKERTLAEWLSSAGFETAAFVSAEPLRRDRGLAAGFRVYDAPAPKRRPEGALALPERAAHATTGAALNWLSSLAAERSFVWVHFFDPHRPWESHGGRPAAVAEASGSPYLGEIAYMDGQIRRLFQAWKEKGLWDDTLVVVVGDHGEGLGEHGEATHGLLAYGATLRVPLVVKPPKGQGTRFVKRPARVADIFPTILEMAGLTAPPRTLARSLMSPDPECISYGETVYPWRQYGWAPVRVLRRGEWEWVAAGAKGELIHWTEDPSETTDLREQRPELAADMEAALLALRRRFRPTKGVGRNRRPHGGLHAPYLAGAGPEVPDEPPAGRESTLVAPRDFMDTVRRLEALRVVVDRLTRGKDVENSFTQAQRWVGMLEEDHRDAVRRAPAVRFWLGRARLSLARAGSPLDMPATWLESSLDAAERHFEAYAALRPKDVRARVLQMQCDWERYRALKDKKAPDRILERARTARALGLDHPLLHVYRARALEALGRLKDAIRAMEEAVAAAPRRADFARDLAALRRKFRD